MQKSEYFLEVIMKLILWGFLLGTAAITSAQNNPCTSIPCQNAGLCSFSGQAFTCTCRSPWTGSTCAVISTTNNPCAANPCQNNGACIRNNNNFQCICVAGYTGQNCQISDGTSTGVVRDPCFPNPCAGGVRCTTFNSDHYSCACPNGLVGLNCETPQSQTATCNPNPCLNGGNCAVDGQGFRCTCTGTEYSGPRCEYRNSEICPLNSAGATACGSRICLNRNVPNEPRNYVCVCNIFEQGIDCTSNSDARVVHTCYGLHCINRVNELGQAFNYYESPGYPQLYEDRLRIQYFLYLPGASEICFEFDDQAFGIEDNKDELYVGPGLEFSFDQFQGLDTVPPTLFFENTIALQSPGVTPQDFCIQSDTVWMYFLTDKNIMLPGFRLSWNVQDDVPPTVLNCPDTPSPIVQTVNLNVQGAFVNWIEPTATDDSGQTPFLISRSHAPGSFFPVNQVTPVTYIYRDGGGNEAVCSFAVFVTESDGIPPVVTGPTQTITRTVPCTASNAIVGFPEPTATDNSGTVRLLSRSHAPGDLFNLGTTTVTYIFADDAQNQQSFSFDVDVQREADITPPTCLPAPDASQTVPLEVSSTSVTYTEPQAQDLCGAVTLISRSHSPGSNFNVGTTIVEYVFRDTSGNQVTCSLRVMVSQVDLIPPVITGDGDIVVTTDLGSGGRFVTFTPPPATDNSGTAILQGSTHTSGQFFPTGRTTVTYTYVDPSGNTATYDFDILVNEVDNLPPVVSPPRGPDGTVGPDGQISVTTQCTGPGTAGLTQVTYTEPTATDNSGQATLVGRTHSPGDMFPVGTTPVTYRFADPTGNIVLYTFDVVVTQVDTTPPVCSAPNDINIEVPLNAGGASRFYTEPTATDLCGTVTLLSRSAAPGDFFSTGTTRVTYVFSDQAGNTVACGFNIIVTEADREPPTVNPPVGPDGTAVNAGGTFTETVECPSTGTTVFFPEPTAIDNSGTVTLGSRSHTPGQFFSLGATEVTYRFSDPSGNTANFVFNVVVSQVDTTPPVCTPPNDVVVTTTLNSGGAIAQWTEATATDTCSTATLISRTTDTGAPASPGQRFNTGTTGVNYMFVDNAGNRVMCGFNVIVTEVDTVPPTVTPPRGPDGTQTPDGSITVTVPCPSTGTAVTYTEPTANDNSGTANLASRTHAPGDIFQVGTTQVTYRFVDPSNNFATYMFDVNVQEVDTTPPVCNTPDDINIEVPLNSGGTTRFYVEPTATDTCSTVTLVSRSDAPGDFFNTGTNRVTYVFRDTTGNTIACGFNILVNEVDRVPPTINPPVGPDGTTINAGGTFTTTVECPSTGTAVNLPEPTATDNSGSVSLDSRSHSSGQFFPVGSTAVTYTYSDPSGNIATFTYNVDVNQVDTTPPVCIPPNDVIVTTPLNSGGAIAQWTEATATDTCSTATLISRTTDTGAPASPGQRFNTGTTGVNYMFIDNAGNRVTCGFNVIVTEVDGVPPTVSPPRGPPDGTTTQDGSITVTVECPLTGRTVDYSEPSATDNSGTVNLASRTAAPGDFFPVGTTQVTYRFVDPSNNFATYTFNVNVQQEDTIPPVCNTPDDINIEVPLNSGGTNRFFVEPTATDTCSTVTLVSRSAAPGDSFNTGTNRVTYVFRDTADNTIACGFNILVNEVDRQPPTINPPVGPDGTTVNSGGTFTTTVECPSTGTIVNFPEPTATDNSGRVTLDSRSNAPGSFFPVGSTAVTYTYSDPSGNIATFTYDVVVNQVDTTPPVCIPPNDVVVTTALNSGGAIAQWTEATATDTCSTATLISRTTDTGAPASPGQRFNTGTTGVNYMFVDNAGNRITCGFNVIVTEVDGVPPTVSPPRGPDGTTTQDGSITVTVQCPSTGRTVTYTEPSATDNSGTANLASRTAAPGDFFPVGTTQVTYRFVDPSNNFATYTFDVNVQQEDTIPPVCNAPDDINIEVPLNSGGTTRFFVEPTATDTCSAVTLVSQSASPGDFFSTGTNRVTYVFRDTASNTIACGFNILVNEVDRQPPTINPPVGPDGTNINSGGTFTTTVECPSTGTTVTLPEPIATDNSGRVTLDSRSHSSGQFFPIGSTAVTYTYSDPSGNVATFTYNVDVNQVDTTPPVCIPPNDVFVTTPLNSGGAVATWTEATATDTCSTATLISRTTDTGAPASPGQRFNTGTTGVNYMFIDNAGNRATCGFNVRVTEVDGTPPTVSPPRGPDGTTTQDGSITVPVECPSPGTIVRYTAPTATDNSGTASVASQTHSPGDFFTVGTTQVTYRFVDPSGNFATYTFDVNVPQVDSTPPVCTPPNDVTVTIPLNTGSAVASWTNPIVRDDCSAVTLISQTASSGDTFNTGISRVTYVYRDDAGNTITCGFNVNVNEVDTTPPTVSGPDSMVITIPLGAGQTTVTWVPPVATDNSGTAILVSQSHNPGDTFMTGTTTVTYVYRDPSGNQVTYEFDIVVNEVDEIPPQIIGPGDITVTTPLGSGGRTVTWTPTITATDNSGSTTLVSATHNPGTFFNTGTTTVTYTYRDPSGNENTYTFNVNVVEVDEVPPTVVCPANVQHTALTGQGGINMEWTEPQAFDNSGTANLATRTHTSGSFFSVGETQVAYTFSDPSGNTASCSFMVIISEANPCLPEPCLNGGTCVIESPTAFTCLCSECYSGNTCQIGNDPCSTNQCANGAACVAFQNSCTQYFCQCPECFTGQFCTQRVDPCENNQCQNGAQCQADPNDCTKYKCVCPSCFTGEFCQNTYSACTNHRCTNGGQCIETPNGGCTEYTCACGGCFTGLFCEQNRDPCALNPCLNGAGCRQVSGSCFSYSCECDGCFTGFNCEIAIPNPCSQNPCQNGGQCNIIPGECFAYSCRCPADFAGINCEIEIPCNDNPCASQPCQNGGSCLTMDASYYICVCPENYLGINCRTLRATQQGFDACLSNPCTNGQCYNSFNSLSAPNNIFQSQYTCVCDNGFTGLNCGFRTTAIPALDICNTPSRPGCRNGGICFNDYHSFDQDIDYFCQCQTNFVGHNCDTFFTNPCASTPCQNGAQCSAMGGFFTCACPNGFTGVLCQTDIVMDNISPSIRNCPQSQSMFAIAGQGGAQVSWVEPTADDTMDPNPSLIRQSHSPNTFFQTGRTTVTYVFMDDAGNAGTCTFFVTVYSTNDDVTPPTITSCPRNVLVGAQDATGGTAQWTEPSATDNSGIDPRRSTTHTPGTRFPLGTSRVTYTFTDVAGNSAICSFNVEVVNNIGPDTIPPQITNCQSSPLIVPANPTTPGGDFTLIEWTEPTATDNSGTVVLEFSNFDEPRVLFQHGNQPVTVEYRYRDAVGNTATCLFDVSVSQTGDIIAPQITNCPASVQVEVPIGTTSAPATWANLIVTDNSGVTPTLVEQTHTAGNTFTLGNTPVRYVYADAAGNRVTCEFTVTVFMMMGTADVTAPRFTFCPNDIIVDARGDSTFEQVTWTIPTAIDESGMATLQTGDPYGNTGTSAFVSTGSQGFEQLTYTFTDPSGNEAVCRFQIGALDTPPNPCLVTPCQNGGQCGQITNSYECSCLNGFEGNKCHLQSSTTTSNPCLPNNCQNSGVCQVNADGVTSSCNCFNGFSGSLCQIPPNPCTSIPCLNNGMCVINNNQVFTCTCVNGFTGSRCESAPVTNPCSPTPCLNNGNCQSTNGGQTFTCTCINGFTGTLCQTQPATNACSSGPCLNSGNCQITNTDGFQCTCVAGYTGTRCQTAPPNPCASSPCLPSQLCFYTTSMFICQDLGGRKRRQTDDWPCQNGGILEEDGFIAKCHCPTGFAGLFCEDSIKIDACNPNPCAHNGSCTDLSFYEDANPGDFACTCVPGWTGHLCKEAEHQNSIQPISEPNYLILNGTVILGLVLLIVVIVILAVFICILTSRFQQLTSSIPKSKADEKTIVY